MREYAKIETQNTLTLKNMWTNVSIENKKIF